MLLYSVKFADILFKFTVIPSMANYILPFPHFLSSEPLDECLLHLALHVDSHLGWIRCCLPPTPKFSFSSWQQGDQPTVSSKHWTVFHDSPHMLEIKCSAMIFLTLFFTCKPQYILITGVALICTINTIVIFVEVICFFGCYCANVIIRHLHLCWVYLRDDSHCISLQHVPRKYLLSDHCQWLGHRWSLQTILLRLGQLGL